jgi:excisionase family DNA binding protein
MSGTAERRLLRAREVAQRLDVSEQRVHELARLDLLPCVRLGRSVRFDPLVVEQWVQSGGQSYPGGWRREAV